MCQWGANRNPRAGYLLNEPIPDRPRTTAGWVANRQPQIEHHAESSSGLITIVVITLYLRG